MNKTLVIIRNEHGQPTDQFEGTIVGETTTHFLIEGKSKDGTPFKELFAKNAKSECFLNSYSRETI